MQWQGTLIGARVFRSKDRDGDFCIIRIGTSGSKRKLNKVKTKRKTAKLRAHIANIYLLFFFFFFQVQRQGPSLKRRAAPGSELI